jgi:hypothetical protein
VIRTVHRLRSQQLCSFQTADLILTKGFGRHDLVALLLDKDGPRPTT